MKRNLPVRIALPMLLAVATPVVLLAQEPPASPRPLSSPSPSPAPGFTTPSPRPSTTPATPSLGISGSRTGGAVAPVRPLSADARARQEASSARRAASAASGDPDVLLDIPNLSVEEINLEVQNLR